MVSHKWFHEFSDPQGPTMVDKKFCKYDLFRSLEIAVSCSFKDFLKVVSLHQTGDWVWVHDKMCLKNIFTVSVAFTNNANSPASGGYTCILKFFTCLSKQLYTFSPAFLLYQTYQWVMNSERCFLCKSNSNLGNCLPKLQSHLPNR